MDTGMKCIVSIAVFAIACFPQKIVSAPTDNTNSGTLTGQFLVEMGSKLNKPLLRLVGKALYHVEKEIDQIPNTRTQEIVDEICRLHPCSLWSEWSDCETSKGREFGSQSRSRNCGVNTTLCKRHAETSVDNDYRLCERKCPDGYSFTKHGFCLKLYLPGKTWDDAEAACQSDGGHLVVVDSNEKVHDLNSTLADQSYSSSTLWIDGRRTEADRPWKFGFQPVDPSFTFWGGDDPDNGPNDLCMYYNKDSGKGNAWRIYDENCAILRNFVCQFK